jgi:hypothetical protein
MEDVETLEGVRFKATEVGVGDCDGVTTIVDGRTRNKEEQSVGQRDGGDDTDPIAVGIREGDEEEEVIIDGDSQKAGRQQWRRWAGVVLLGAAVIA